MSQYPAHLTLRQKFALKAAELRSSGVIRPSARSMDWFAPKAFYFMIVTIVGWLELFGLPFFYTPEDRPGMLLFNRALSIFIGTQIYVQWHFLKHVKSRYVWNPDKAPAKAELGEEIKAGMKSGKQKDGGFAMWVATGFPDASNKVPRKAFPYWSWVPCLMCQKLRPPRCHHCPFCQMCVLKRDHHCFFTNNCVGSNNLRYYVTYLFWAAIGTTYFIAHLWTYMFYDAYATMHWMDVFPPCAFVRAWLGYERYTLSFMGSFGWVCTFLVSTLWIALFGAFESVCKAFTLFERENEIKIPDGRTLSEKFRAVFGRYWALNFLFPTHFFFPPEEDCVSWPFVKM